jgi:hypothetical protein
MRSFVRVSFDLVVVMMLLGTGTAQVKGSAAAHTFRNDNLGLTYTFPEVLAPSPDEGLPRDPKGREYIILALWDQPRRTPVPRIVFLYDTKPRPSTWSSDTIAHHYLRTLTPGEGYKMGQPQRMSVAGKTTWRMDYWKPDDSGQSYNCAMVFPLEDRRVLFIQLNAPSERELDLLRDSLKGLKFDRP